MNHIILILQGQELWRDIMLKAIKPDMTKVIGVERQDESLMLNTENGKIMIEVCHSSIVRIVYTLEKDIKKERGPALKGHKQKSLKKSEWNYSVDAHTIRIDTERLKIIVNKATAAIMYYDQNNRLLLKETEKNPKELIPFDSYKTVFDENSRVRRIKTPDGMKEVLDEGKKVFDKKSYHSRLHFKWKQEEALYGMGQHEEGFLNLRGQRIYLHQGNLKIAIPMLVSTEGYGLLFDCYSPLIFNDSGFGSYIYGESQQQVEYYFIHGTNFDDIIGGYRFLTGRASMLPKWSFGFIQSLERYESSEELIETVKEYRKREVPIDGIVLDWQSWEGELWGQKTFDKTRFSNPKSMIQKLHDLDVHFMISIWPNMSRDSENFKEMAKAKCNLPQSEIYDAYRQEARELYWQQAYQGLFVHGIDAWWCDSSEPFTPEWNEQVRPEPDQNYLAFYNVLSQYSDPQYSNAYALFHAQGIYEGQRSVMADKRVVNLTRSGYHGQQKYGVILWSGDISAKWSTLKKQVPAGLNLCASGLPYWTFDIGGFFVKQGQPWFWDGDFESGNEDLGYRELYTRWYQLGAFLPIFRSHGTDTRREIWCFGEKGEMFYDAINKYTKLRYRLLPYIYSIASGVHFRQETMMRILAFDYQEDVEVYDIKDQFMFGKQIMVCPICEPMYYGPDSIKIENVSRTRQLYLPGKNMWYDYWTSQVYEGRQWIRVDAPIDILPLFIPAGSILPMAKEVQSTNALDNGSYDLQIYCGASGKFTLYLDEGNNYNYEKDECVFIDIHWNDTEKELVIEKVRGSYKDMPAKINFHIEYIGERLDKQNVIYDYKKMVIKNG